MKKRIVIAGAGFAGSILAQQLMKHTDAEVIVFDKCSDIEASDTGTGLNLNSNGLAALKSLDTELEEHLRSFGLPRQHMSAETMSGEILYKELISDNKGNGIAKNTGLRVRWADAYTAIRHGVPIRYNTELLEFEAATNRQNKAKIKILNHNNGKEETIDNIDLLVGADGRYSKIRQNLSPATPEFIGVSNFRILVPDHSNDIFGDMELIYNSQPVARSYGNRTLSEEFLVCANSIARVGIMQMPKTVKRQKMLYMYGNFTIPDEVPKQAKTKEGLLSLYTPMDSELSSKGQYILKIISENSLKLHWSRMQYIPICFGNPESNVLLLGDASHAIVPTLGQGATIAIEDACYAASAMVDLLNNAQSPSEIIRLMERNRTQRHQFISDVSNDASRHMMPNDLTPDQRISGEVEKWENKDSHFRRDISQVWNGAPKLRGFQ